MIALLAELDMLARGGALSLLALWSWLLLRDHRAALAARLAVLMTLCICCYLIVTAAWPRGVAAVGGVIPLLLSVGAGTTAAAFWLFARAWFGDRSRVEGWAILLVVLTAANVALLQLTYPGPGPLFQMAVILFRLSMFGFAAAGMWAAWRGRGDDLVEPRRRLRLALILGVGAYVVVVNIIEILVRRGVIAPASDSLIEAGALILVFGFCAAMFAHRQGDLFAEPQRPSPSTDDADVGDTTQDPLTTRLRDHVEDNKIWRDEGLTIAALAAQLGVQEYRLRRTINGALGFRNFAAFLNGYRLAEVKAALADPAQRDVPILTIALDAGFGSIGSFNRAFRDAEGMTPSQYRQQRLVDSGIDQP